MFLCFYVFMFLCFYVFMFLCFYAIRDMQWMPCSSSPSVFPLCTTMYLIMELKGEDNQRILSLGHRTIALCVMAVAVWVKDHMFCSWWASVGFPYLHGAWHVLVFLSSYTAVVLTAYFQVKNNIHSETLILRWNLEKILTMCSSLLMQVLSIRWLPVWSAVCPASEGCQGGE